MKNLTFIHGGVILAEVNEWEDIDWQHMPHDTYIHQNWKPEDGIVWWHRIFGQHPRQRWKVPAESVPSQVRAAMLLVT